MRDSDYCVFHDPEHAEVVQEARRAGGQRRKREATIATAYDFEGLTSIQEIRRLIEVAAMLLLHMDAVLREPLEEERQELRKLPPRAGVTRAASG